jgi:hypothetical protein
VDKAAVAAVVVDKAEVKVEVVVVGKAVVAVKAEAVVEEVKVAEEGDKSHTS